MKRLLISIFFLLSSIAFIFAEGQTETATVGNQIKVSFASNSKLPSLRYYLDSNKTNEMGESTDVSRGDTIYYDYLESDDSVYTLEGFRIVYYLDGERIIYSDIKNGEAIIVPDTHVINSISIEPYGAYRKRSISLSDISDGVELDGIWRISDEVFTSGDAEINPYESYYVSYEYDSDRYYLVSAEPEKKVLSQSSGSVLYNVENPDSPSRTDNYKVELKPYTYISIDEPARVIEIVKDGKNIDPGFIESEKFKAGDSIEIATGRDYRIECSGAEVKEVQLLSDRRIFSLTIPEDNRDYELEILLKKQRTKVLDIAIDGEYSENSDITLRVNLDTYTLEDIIKGREIILTEGDFIYLTVEKPDQNTRVMLTVDSEQNDLDITSLDIRERTEKSYSFDEIGEIVISFDKGYRFEEITNNDEEVKAEYLVDGTPVEDGEFLKEGTIVEIAVDLPSHLKAKGLNIETGSDRGYVEISEATSKWDFQIKSEKRAGLYFDPAEYTFDNVELEFSSSGRIIRERTFLENGNVLSYKVKSIEPGYRMNDGAVLVEGESGTRRKLNEIKASEEAKVNISLKQPEYGGKVIYSSSGNVINGSSYTGYAGDIINIEYKADNGWIRNAEFPTEVRIDENTFEIDSSDAFIELESHKSEFLLTISPTVGDYFAVDVSSITGSADFRQYSERRSFIFRTLVPSTESFGKIPSTPFSLRLSGYSLARREALKLTLIVRNKSDKEIRREIIYTKANEFDFIYDAFTSDQPSEIELVIEKCEVYEFEEMNIANGTLTVTERDTGRVLKSGDMITASETVTVSLVADEGYYIYTYGNISEAISESKGYMEHISTFDDFASKYQIRKWCSLELKAGGEHESYAYYLNDKEVSLGRITYKEGDKLKLVYKVDAPYYVAGTLFSSRNTSKTITLQLSHDNQSINKDDFGITIKEVGR